MLFSNVVFATQTTHDHFARHVAEFLLTEDELKNSTVEDCFNLLRENGIEPKGGFKKGKKIDVEESIQLFGKLITKDKNYKLIKKSSISSIYKNKVTVLKLQGKVYFKNNPEDKWEKANENIDLSKSAMINVALP